MSKALRLGEVRQQQAEEDLGMWFEPHCGGEYHVSYLGRDEFAARQERIERSLRSKLGIKAGKPLPSEARVESTIRAMFGTVVNDWRDVLDENDQPIPFTEDNFFAVVREVRGLFNTLVDFTTERENFHAERVEEVRGKS